VPQFASSDVVSVQTVFGPLVHDVFGAAQLLVSLWDPVSEAPLSTPAGVGESPTQATRTNALLIATEPHLITKHLHFP
jgi:hypothetical protein